MLIIFFKPRNNRIHFSCIQINYINIYDGYLLIKLSFLKNTNKCIKNIVTRCNPIREYTLTSYILIFLFAYFYFYVLI